MADKVDCQKQTTVNLDAIIRNLENARTMRCVSVPVDIKTCYFIMKII